MLPTNLDPLCRFWTIKFGDQIFGTRDRMFVLRLSNSIAGGSRTIVCRFCAFTGKVTKDLVDMLQSVVEIGG